MGMVYVRTVYVYGGVGGMPIRKVGGGRMLCTVQ